MTHHLRLHGTPLLVSLGLLALVVAAAPAQAIQYRTYLGREGAPVGYWDGWCDAAGDNTPHPYIAGNDMVFPGEGCSAMWSPSRDLYTVVRIELKYKVTGSGWGDIICGKFTLSGMYGGDSNDNNVGGNYNCNYANEEVTDVFNVEYNPGGWGVRFTWHPYTPDPYDRYGHAQDNAYLHSFTVLGI